MEVESVTVQQTICSVCSKGSNPIMDITVCPKVRIFTFLFLTNYLQCTKFFKIQSVSDLKNLVVYLIQCSANAPLQNWISDSDFTSDNFTTDLARLGASISKLTNNDDRNRAMSIACVNNLLLSINRCLNFFFSFSDPLYAFTSRRR